MERVGEPSTRERYRRFGDVEARAHSPTYERLAGAIARDDAIIELLDRLPPAKRQPNLVLAAARYTGAPLHDTAGFLEWMRANWAVISDICRERATQTNEARRLTSLLPALGQIDGPIALIELGASAGLCLIPDRYSYRYGSGERIDPPAGESPVVLDTTVEGSVPALRVPEIAWRVGVDLHPLNAGDRSDIEWLETLIWPEHADRVVRLRRAAQLVADDPPEIVQGDLVDALPALVSNAPRDATVVVMHTAVMPYVVRAERERLRMRLADLSRSRRMHWVADESPPGIGFERHEAHSADFAVALDGRLLGYAGPHGDHLHWLSSPKPDADGMRHDP